MTNSNGNGSRTSHNIRPDEQYYQSNTVKLADQAWNQPVKDTSMNGVVNAPRARFAHIKDLQLRAQRIIEEYGSHLPVSHVSLRKPATSLRSYVSSQSLLTWGRCGSS